MSPAQSTVGIAQGLFAFSQLFGPSRRFRRGDTTQRRVPFATVKWDQAEADAVHARATLACLVFLNRLRLFNSAQLAAATLPSRWPSSPLRR